MKITKVESIFIDRYLFCKVHTDAGITGLGESGAWGYLEASAQVIDKYGRYLMGKDPLTIEHHWQYMYRSSHFRGAAIMGALSAIDIALWDIAGKHFGVPVYQLLGGPTRNKARVYYHVFGKTRKELVDGIVAAKGRGFTAVGHLTPFVDVPKSEPYFMTHSDKMRDAVDAVRQYREAVGDEVDLCIEIHRRLTPAEAIVLARGIEQYRPYFYEDPILPDNFDMMGLVAEHINIPIATGERIHTIFEFEMLLARNAVQYVRPDVCMCGGISGAKKVAALAEARHVGVVPHNPLSPVSTAACLQIAACIPNFALQEFPLGDGQPPKTEIVNAAYRLDNGFVTIPNVPGIGAELIEGAEQKHPYYERKVETRLNIDGSVMDQ
ncbi:MAG: galactonate dehydratase [Bacteroidetes bacterium]|nr:galactonate dehydratase [Bacteroidota bacterium]MCL5025403.1 galactonate dehydratase [Chloroflexota bacterium]